MTLVTTNRRELMTSEVKKNKALGDHTKLQLAEDYRYPTSTGRMDKFNKGIATAITALKQSCDNQGVFTWGEATYFILPPIVKAPSLAYVPIS